MRLGRREHHPAVRDARPGARRRPPRSPAATATAARASSSSSSVTSTDRRSARARSAARAPRRGRRASPTPTASRHRALRRTTRGRRSSRASATTRISSSTVVVGAQALRHRDLHAEDAVVARAPCGRPACGRSSAPPRAGDRSPPARGRRSTSPCRASRRPPASAATGARISSARRQSLREQRRRRPGTRRRTRPPRGGPSRPAPRSARRTGRSAAVSASAYAIAGQPRERRDLAVDVAPLGERRHRALAELEAAAPDPTTVVAIMRSRRTSGCAVERRRQQRAPELGQRRDPRARRAARASPRTVAEHGVPRAGRDEEPDGAVVVAPLAGVDPAPAADVGEPLGRLPGQDRLGHHVVQLPPARRASGSRAGRRRAAPASDTASPGHGGRHLVVGAAERGELDEAVERVGRRPGRATCSHTYSPIVTPGDAREQLGERRPALAPARAARRRPRASRRTRRPRRAVNRRSSSRSTTASPCTARRATPSSGNVRDPTSTCALPGSRSTSPASSAAPSDRGGTSCTSSSTKQIGVGALAHTTLTTHSTSSSTSARGGGSVPNCASSRPARRAALASAGSSRRWTSTPTRARRFSRTAWAISVVLPNPAPATMAVTGRVQRPCTIVSRRGRPSASRDRDRRLVEDPAVERVHPRSLPTRPSRARRDRKPGVHGAAPRGSEPPGRAKKSGPEAGPGRVDRPQRPRLHPVYHGRPVVADRSG